MIHFSHILRRGILLAGAAACLLAPPLRGLDTPLGPVGLGARSLAMSGAVTALDSDAESIFWNPAGLANLGQMEGSLMAGPDGQNGPFNTAMVLAAPYEDYGFFGFSFADSRQGQVSSFRTGRLSLAAAVPLTSELALGTQQKLLSADPGGMTGWSMDMGAQMRFSLPQGYGKEIKAGLSLMDMASYLGWKAGREESQPMVVQAGAAWVAPWSLKVAAELDNENDVVKGSLSQWRLGAQKGFLNECLALRLGTTQIQGSDPYVSAGFGALFPFAGMTYRLDYAWLAPTGNLTSLSAARQLFSLSVVFADLTRPQPGAEFSKLLTDSSHKVRHARVSLKGFEGVKSQDWELTITDAQGRPLRTIKGKGALPPQANWDGRDETGNLVDAQDFSYSLRVTTTDGKVLSRKGPLAPAAGAGNGFGELAGLEGEAGGLRATGGKTGVARVRPTLKGVGNQLAGADFDLSDVSDGDTQSWELKVVDSEGRTLRTFSGKGNPPKNIKWEGRDESGEIVSTDLSAGYELRVVNDKGAQKVIKQDLVTQSGYAQALKQAVEQAAALPAAEVPPSGAAWKTRCFLDANTGVWRCRFFFKGREARLNREQVADLADLAEKIQKYPKRVVHLHGVSLDPHDGLQAEKLAQERANAVLKNLMETYSLNPRILKVTANDLTARGAKEGVGMSFVETEVFPGQAPPVEVCLDYVVSQVLAELKSARLKETSPFSPLREVSKSALKPAPTPGARPQAPEGTQEEEAPSVPEPVSVVKPVAYPTVPVFDPSKEYKPLPIREK